MPGYVSHLLFFHFLLSKNADLLAQENAGLRHEQGIAQLSNLLIYQFN
jgi:hypothetical protein